MKRLIVLALVMSFVVVFLVFCATNKYTVDEIMSYYPTRDELILLNELAKCDTDKEWNGILQFIFHENYYALADKILKLMDIYYWKPEGILWVDLFAILAPPSKRSEVYLTYSIDLVKKFGYSESYNYYQDDEEIKKLKRKLRDVEDLLGFIITELENKPRDNLDIRIKPPR